VPGKQDGNRTAAFCRNSEHVFGSSGAKNVGSSVQQVRESGVWQTEVEVRPAQAE
jgi:hypothetical protein